MVTKKIKSIDLYKGIAIIFVIITHFAQLFNLPHIMDRLSRFGQMGCQIFFALSCFSLCLSYSKNSPKYFDFLKKRFIKIHVGYYIMIIVFLILRLLSIPEEYNTLKEAINLKGILVNMLFLNGLSRDYMINNKIVYGGWFVGTLVFFYLLFPLLYKIFINKKGFIKRKICYFIPILISITLTIGLLILRVINSDMISNNNVFIYNSFINQLSSFCVGFILFDIYSSNSFDKIKYPFVKFIILFILSGILFYKGQIFMISFLPSIFSLSFLYLFCFTYKYIENLTDSNFIYKVLEKFGKNSFEIFLTQSIVIWCIFGYGFIKKISIRFIPNDLIRFFIFLPIIYITTYLFGYILSSIIKGISTLNKRRKI